MLTSVAAAAAGLSLVAGVGASVTSERTLSGSYVPSYIQCPSNQTYIYTRSASTGLARGEAAWLETRKSVVTDALQSYLNNVNISDFDVDGYISTLKQNSSFVPTIAMTLSGGGNRAEYCGLGLLQALDARYSPALAAGTGGILQAMTYQAGLSGGGFATFANAANSFAPLQSLVDNGNFNLSVNPAVFDDIGEKAELGFPVGIPDAFAGTQCYHLGMSLTNSSANSLSMTWSGFQANPAFTNGSIPMPIFMIEEVLPPGVPGAITFDTPNGTLYFPANNSLTIFEATPFEFGSWTGRIKAFTDIAYLGTNYSNSAPVNTSECVEGLDTGAYLTGTSAAAVNLWLAQYYTNGTVGQFAKRQEQEQGKLPYPANEAVIEQMRVNDATAPFIEFELPEILGAFGNLSVQDALYGIVANPWFGIEDDSVEDGASQQGYLFLVDGSEGGQVNPLWPVIQTERHVDFIIVSDNSGTELSSGWMNGTTLLNTYETATRAGLAFPRIPSVRTMLNKNYTSTPTFFGCNDGVDTPLVLYVADAPYTSYTNISLVLDQVSDNQLDLVFQNAFVSMTQDSNKLAANWSTCIACGAIQKSVLRMQVQLPEVCRTCFQDHCWQGDEDDSEPGFLAPFPKLNQTLTWAEWNATVWNA